MHPEIELPGGARMSVFPTPALVAIDVDAGSAMTGARGQKASAQMSLNRAAIPAIAAQIRLRNLSGAILLDFAGMKTSRRLALGPCPRRSRSPPIHCGRASSVLRHSGWRKSPARASIRPCTRCWQAHMRRDWRGLRALMAAEPTRIQNSGRLAGNRFAALAADAVAMADFARMPPDVSAIVRSDPGLDWMEAGTWLTPAARSARGPSTDDTGAPPAAVLLAPVRRCRSRPLVHRQLPRAFDGNR